MRGISLYIDQAGKGVAPENWIQTESINLDRRLIRLQRLYYIKSGRGEIILPDGERRPFDAGKIYIFPYNLPQRFETDPLDRIDHIYFDFISTPPIIADRPIVYSVDRAAPVAHMIELLDSLLVARRVDGARTDSSPATGIRSASDAPCGSEDEYRQIIYQLLYSLLLLLSHDRELPFMSDEVIISSLEYMRAHENERISVGELASRAGFELNYFIRRFKRAMGITPYAYMRACRLIRAEELLSRGGSVTSTAELVGYENASSLSRAMRGIRD